MKLLSLFLALLIGALATPASAQRVNQPLPFESGALDGEIAAIVNENVVSTFDLEARVRLAILSAGLPDSPEIHRRLLPQILRSLIDEQLEMQEAKRLDITISKEDIDKALVHIATDNHIEGDMRSYLASHDASPESLVNQIRTSLAWAKVIQRELRPRVEISDDEVEQVLERIRSNAGKDEYMMSEIYLVVENPKDEDQVHQFADNLTQQLKSGANFNAAARQFSQGPGAASGGDIGWIQEGQLQPEIDRALTTMHEGDIVGPIRTSNGYHILGLRQKRTISLGDPKDVMMDLEQAFRPGEDTKSATEEAVSIRSTLSDCHNLEQRLKENFPAWRWQSLGTMTFAKAPAWIADKVHNVETGHASELIATEKGSLLLFVCGRKMADEHINREAISNSLGTEKLELQARRLLRDLRRSAYLDIRLRQLL